ncbi:MAG: succinyl-CoA--3-ketoacid-CoA transferase, partial [Bacteroidales bacterium]|nr:succinyl-CoA--3-ketoacid-CoA transferase [Bacteroidales bacterium]
NGQPKLKTSCDLPLTGVNCVKKIVTDLAVIEVTDKGFKLLERAPGVSVDEIIGKTGAPLIIEGDIPEMKL